MAVDRQISASPAAWPSVRRLADGGTTGNGRLTAVTGGVLIVLLAVIGLTIIALRPLLSVHLFVGMLLIGPVALKLCSTGYRFVRYYTANPRYRSDGPPPLLLRVIAPIVVVSTVVVLASGVALLFAGPGSRGTLLPIHKLSFFIWIPFTALHVLAHIPATRRLLRADYGHSAQGSNDVGGRAGRILSLTGALTGGVVLAILVIPQFGPWLTQNLHHH
jgi:membrane protein implicated in regulation of membrane protease activity